MELLTAAAVCRKYKLNPKQFRQLVRDGRGPKAWNPFGGRTRYVSTNVERWLEERDDRPQQRKAA